MTGDPSAALEALLAVLCEQEDDLARSLHDQVSPALAAMRLTLSALAATLPAQAAPSAKVLEASLDELESWTQRQRRAARTRLLSRMSLGDALEWTALQLEGAGCGAFSVDDRLEGRELPPLAALSAFGTLQDFLADGGPRSLVRVALSWEQDRTLRLEARLSGPRVRAPRPDEAERASYRALLEALGGSVQQSEDEGGARLLVRLPVS